jgi:hypothetical protein
VFSCGFPLKIGAMLVVIYPKITIKIR